MKVKQYQVISWTFLDSENEALILPAGEITDSSGVSVDVWAFKCDATHYRLNFMPNYLGIYRFELEVYQERFEGEFECVKPTKSEHGPVRAVGLHFEYADGQIYRPFGTTCYAWINQPKKLQIQTLQTLSKSPFNKVRMGIFPKSMPFNHNDPEYYPFQKNTAGQWQVDKLDFRFWDNLEKRINDLQHLNIQADLILFHPYDRWGFETLTPTQSLAYVRYVVVRLGAYANVWWSLANEYEMILAKTNDDWDQLGMTISSLDMNHHLISIHDILQIYPKRDWMSHCSIQSTDLNQILNWRYQYQCPIVIDECGYEGDIDFSWGDLTPQELVYRLWCIMCRGGYGTHGETYSDDDEILWWAKGGQLHGESTTRIEFLKDIFDTLSIGIPRYRDIQDPNMDKINQLSAKSQRFRKVAQNLPEPQRERVAFVEPMVIIGTDYVLKYLGREAPRQTTIELPVNSDYQLEVIDTWEMTQKKLSGTFNGLVKVKLPRKPGMAILGKKKIEL